MASLEEIRAGLDTPTHKNVNGERVDLTSQEVEDILDFQAEQLVVERGLDDAKEDDIADERQFLLNDVAENIDEEDEGLGLSDEMKGVYS